MSRTRQERKKNEWIPFASIGRPHGLKGAFFLTTEDRRKSLEDYEILLIQTKAGEREARVKSTYLSGDKLVVELEGISSREEVERLYQSTLCVSRSEISPTEDEYLVSDLRGMRVFAEGHGEIGEVVSVIGFGAQENLEIRRLSGGPTLYFPFLEPFILNVDENLGRIDIVYVPEFLEDKS